MRGRPSITARHVGWQRSHLERPASPSGDPEADCRLERSLRGWLLLPTRAGVLMAPRTSFFDDQTQAAIARGVQQIIILGAGYDGRALRFAQPGVQFFEVDHPATQVDKRRRLAAAAADVANITFVAADLTGRDLADLLAAAGHDRAAATLFVCEGVFAYLPPAAIARLLRTAHDLAAAGSVFACNCRVRPATFGRRGRVERLGVDTLLRVIGEPRRSDFVPGEVEGLVTDAGWTIDERLELDHQRQGCGLLLAART